MIVDDRRRRHHLATRDQQTRQQGSWQRAPQRHLDPVDMHRQRAQNADLEWHVTTINGFGRFGQILTYRVSARYNLAYSCHRR